MPAPDDVRTSGIPGGIITVPLDQRKVSQRRKRFCERQPEQLGQIPGEWRELLARWVKRGGNSRWETLCKDAGVTGNQVAHGLLEWLLREGWASVVEHRQHGGWWPQALELRNMPKLRAALGINDKTQDAQRWQTAREKLESLCGVNLAPALLALDELPVNRALARYDLVAALQRWQDAQKSGTRRDFAFEARGDTKGVSEAEWNWLERTLDLAEYRIERHTPLLLLSAPLTLMLPHGQLDLAVCADFAALTPDTLQSATSATGVITHWKLVENRTSFERAARQRCHDEGVIWLPGFPPDWWRKSVGHLLDLAPAPAHIACDPDPAGIAIAMLAAELWRQRQLAWQPLKMGADDLSGLSARKALCEPDRQQLESLLAADALPAMLAGLAHWMLEHGEKGEQEGYL
jgi:hypothetical protein